ncbi:MAG: hypothetical protein HQK50_12555 [Oligoflexia bacterium]|nr:hypothetical protein [Oligoflexia bacterium]MBF0366395.1 hypothetical protein [Oligoflexia bacterium]
MKYSLLSFITLACLLASFVTKADSVSFEKIDDTFFLTANNCELLQKQTTALEKWQAIPHQELYCSCDAKNLCKVDITPLLIATPIKTTLGKLPICHGPNCFNAALVASQILPYFRLSDDKEFKFWVNSPLCRKLSYEEEKRPGDVVAIRESVVGEYEVHPFIYLTEELAYTKNGYRNDDMPYALMPVSEIMQTYNVRKECYTKQPTNEECWRYATYYRCDTLPEYAKKQGREFKLEKSEGLFSQQQELKNIVQTINEIDHDLFKASMTGCPLALAKRFSLFELSNDLCDAAKAVANDPLSVLLCQGLEKRLDAFKIALRYLF